VAEIVAIDPEQDPAFNEDDILEDPFDALRVCSSLISVLAEDLPDAARKVVLAHYSVKEYLLSDRIQRGDAVRYGLHSASSNAVLARSCLGYLAQFENPDTFSRSTMSQRKLARYSAQFWIDHVQAAGQEMPALSRHIMDFFASGDGAYLNWTRIYDIDRPWMEPDVRKQL
jgi:hypothetical protein